MKGYFLFILILLNLGHLLGQDVKTPSNRPCLIHFDKHSGLLTMTYDGERLLSVVLKTGKNQVSLVDTDDTTNGIVTQVVVLKGAQFTMRGVVDAGPQAVAAEASETFQKAFPLVRTTIGNASWNLRNNALYNRLRDWMIEFNGNAPIRIVPTEKIGVFKVQFTGDTVEMKFRPRYYQIHKGIQYFTPWTYNIKKESITGWSSWWAYFRDFNESDLRSLLKVWKEKQFADYGYKFIQIDDVFQGGSDSGSQAPKKGPNGYFSTGPKTWLNWKKDLFPGGMSGYVMDVHNAGFTPAVWIGANFTDLATTERHPDWFIQDSTGKPFVGQWISFGVDANNCAAADSLIRPTFRGLRKAGFPYVKLDLLRHYLYDNLHRNLGYCANHGTTPDSIFRSYIKIARQEMGNDAFLLSCWGVLPQAVGIVDACRIGGDGYGPVTMQQYSSWNGIVWINDPDHCDVYPHYKPAEVGNVSSKSKVVATSAETRLRPSLASIAGSVLILSDKPQVYEDDNNLEGLRRAAPVLASVPGQLYDFDPSKTSKLPSFKSNDIVSGAGYSPLDADQFGTVCPWWLNEINRKFEHWNVLSHMNWSKEPFAEEPVHFSRIGLDSSSEYLVFEFWDKKFLGVLKDFFPAKALRPNEIATYSIRKKLNRPQIVSTNRHLTQGGPDLQSVKWEDGAIRGISNVVKNDRYVIYLYIPPAYRLKSASFGNSKASVKTGELTEVSFVPNKSGQISWQFIFDK
jgi:hypothetical protein